MEMIGITTRYSVEIRRPGVTAEFKIHHRERIAVKDATDHREIAEKVRKIWKARELYYDEIKMIPQPGFRVHYYGDDRRTQDFQLSITRKSSRSTKYDVELLAVGKDSDVTYAIRWQESVEEYQEKTNSGDAVIKDCLRRAS